MLSSSVFFFFLCKDMYITSSTSSATHSVSNGKLNLRGINKKTSFSCCTRNKLRDSSGIIVATQRSGEMWKNYKTEVIRILFKLTRFLTYFWNSCKSWLTRELINSSGIISTRSLIRVFVFHQIFE